MPATLVQPTKIAAAGTNVTDATFATLTTGAGNGIKFNFVPGQVLILKNDTGFAAQFDVVSPQPDQFSKLSITVPDKAISVADGKTYAFYPAKVYADGNGQITVECDQAGKALLLNF